MIPREIGERIVEYAQECYRHGAGAPSDPAIKRAALVAAIERAIEQARGPVGIAEKNGELLP